MDLNSVCAKIAHTAEDGKKYDILFYNLDAIISVGYRVNSNQATQFRIWATKTLKENMLKGFVLDDDRLKQGEVFLVKITLMNYLNESGRSGQVNTISRDLPAGL